MDIKKIKYNQELIKNKIRLEKELKMVNQEIEDNQDKCNHIKVCIGWDGSFLYRDSSINLCLICGEKDPVSKYKTLQAYDYKKEYYSHGEMKTYREKRFIEIQQLALNIITEQEDITEEELIQKLNNIIEEDTEKEKSTNKQLKYKKN